MSEILKISEVSRRYGVTTRTLRYYEQIGLLPAIRSDEYAYRMYDADALSRLQQIIVLKKLRFPLEDIRLMLAENDTRLAVDVFTKHLDALDEETAAMQKLRDIVEAFLQELKRLGWHSLRDSALSEDTLFALEPACRASQREDFTMDELTKVSEKTAKFGPLRILWLPPMRMARYLSPVGPAPEMNGWKQVNALVKKTGLLGNPAVRIFGFDNPPAEGDHGYEFRVLMPEGIDIPAPFEELKFGGGLYAAHVTTMDSIFETWMYLFHTIEADPRYQFDDSPSDHPLLEESLGEKPLQFFEDEPEDMSRQLDLLLPIKPR